MFDEAKQLHQRGVDGDKEAVGKALQLLEKIRTLAPGDNQVEAYYGSVISLLGRDAVDPRERFEKALKGLKILDQAVGREPENSQIRVLRAYVSSRLPEAYFHRTHTAVEDFSYLVSQYEQGKGDLSGEFHAQLLYDLGMACKTLGRTEEAEAAWRKLLAKAEGAKYARLLRQEGIKAPGAEDETEAEAKAAPASDAPSHAAEVLDEGIGLHRRALAGDSVAAEKAAAFFAKALEANPGDQLLLAYAADCLSMKGRDAADPGEMFTGAIRAMQMFDRAVNFDPNNVRVRYLRGYHSYRLPEAFFRRTATAINDLEYVAGRYEEDHTLLSGDSYRQLLYDLGLAYRRLGMKEEGEAAWRKLLDLAADSKFREMIEKQLRKPCFVPSDCSSQQGVYAEGMHLHDLAVAGNTDATKMALELWEKALKADPEDTLAQAYHGSCLALTGRDATDPGVIFTNTIKGLKELNRAIGRDWQDPRKRMLRAYLCYSLPESFFHLTERAIKDFRYLKSAYERDANVFTKEQYHRILYDLGRAYQRLGETEAAAKVWRRLREAKPGPDLEELLPDIETADVDGSPAGKEGEES